MSVNPLQVFQQYADAWNRHDAAAIVASFADGGTYSDPITSGPLTGAAIGSYAETLWAAFPDLSFETVSSMENGDGLLSAEWLMRGTNIGPLNGLSPCKRRQDMQRSGLFRPRRCATLVGTRRHCATEDDWPMGVRHKRPREQWK